MLGCVDEASATFAGTSWSAALCPSPNDPAITLTGDFGRLDCPCQAVELCDNGVDDDCDGLVDCADPDCDASACGPHGLVCNDSACACAASRESCNNVDDDCDGLIDEGCPAGVTAPGPLYDLAQFGGTGGSVFDITCFSGTAMTEFVGYMTTASRSIYTLIPHCGPIRVRAEATTPELTYEVRLEHPVVFGGVAGNTDIGSLGTIQF